MGRATRATPITTSAIPHQRRGEIHSPSKSQQPTGTRISTTRESGNATLSGMYRSTYSQLIKLATISRIAHHTSGDARPLIPVQERARCGSATSVAPRFSSSSETNTHTTLSASCNHGLPKPRGRFCMRFCSLLLNRRNQFRLDPIPASRFRVAVSQLIGIWKALQNRVMPCRSKIFDKAAKDRVEQRTGMPDVEVQRRQLAIQMELRLVIERIAVVIFQSLLERPRNDVAQRVEIEVQIQSHAVVQPDAFIVNRVTAHQAKAEGDDFSLLPPDEEARPIRHALARGAEIVRRQSFKV